jgi:hypothetical protein
MIRRAAALALLAAPLFGCAAPPVSQSPETITLRWDEPGPPPLARMRGPSEVGVRWNPAAEPEPARGLAQQACAAGDRPAQAKEVAERRVRSDEIARFDCR